MGSIGHKRWAIAGGCIPVHSSGIEPAHTSHERLSIMNPGRAPAHLKITAFWENRDPVGPYDISISPRRIRVVRLNDLVNPEALVLGEEYGLVVESDVPVVIQMLQLNTGPERGSTFSLLAFGA